MAIKIFSVCGEEEGGGVVVGWTVVSNVDSTDSRVAHDETTGVHV
jgi:hypothetical protein